MCGLVGIAGDTTGNWKDVFSELLLVDSVRGLHSTGAGFVHRTSLDFSLAKAIGHPFNLLHKKEYDMAMKEPAKVIMGHNRHATIGEHTEANAHPFAFPNVLGMHNGTLDKWVINDLHDHAKFGTDSEAIMATIEAKGIEATMKLIHGAWAFVWFDKRDDTLNMLHNGKRPLHYCYSEDRCTLIWASEAVMLRYVLNRRNKKSQSDEIFTPAKDTHYTWKVPMAINEKFDSPTQTLREGGSYLTYYSNPTAPFSGGAFRKDNSTTTYGRKSNNVVIFKKKGDTKKFRPPYKDMYGHVITKKDFDGMVEQGCSFCGDTSPRWMDFVQIMGPWMGPKNTPFACSLCYEDTDVYDSMAYVI